MLKKTYTRYKTEKNSISVYLWRAAINSDSIHLIELFCSS